MNRFLFAATRTCFQISVVKAPIFASFLLFGATTILSPPFSMSECVTHPAVDPTHPQTLSEVFTSIRTVFDVALSLEGIPEESGHADPSGREVSAFSIRAGESFASVMNRVVAASGDVYKFEVIRGTPVLRPNPEVVKTPSLLDTVVDLEIEGSTIWDALCDLARRVNAKNLAKASKSFYIHLQGPEFMELPPPVFLEENKVSVELHDVTAREAMCAVMESANQPFTYYFYVWPGDFSYVSVVAHDAGGEVLHGRRVRDPQHLESWSDENIHRLQSPVE